jgi:hypothetical protein
MRGTNNIEMTFNCAAGEGVDEQRGVCLRATGRTNASTLMNQMTASATTREEEGARATGWTAVAGANAAQSMPSAMTEEELHLLTHRMNNLLIRPLTFRIPNYRFILPSPTSSQESSSQNAVGIADPSQVRRERRRGQMRQASRNYRARLRSARQQSQSDAVETIENVPAPIEVPDAVNVQDDVAHPMPDYDDDVPEQQVEYYNVGSMDQVCQYCQALLFSGETSGLCCNNGQTQLAPLRSVPDRFKRLFTDRDQESRHFRSHIRAYNSIHAFTSTGVKVDDRFQGNGVSNFRIHGEMYHRMGSILPLEGNMPQFHQIYVYDPSDQVAHRQNLMDNLDSDVCETISDVLTEFNPYVRVFRNAAAILDRDPATNLSMVLRADPNRDSRRFNIPTADEVAVMLDSNVQANRRDIVLHKNSGFLTRISELNMSYDPLHYVLLFPNGEYGFHLNIPKNCRNEGQKRKNITISDFYSYRLMLRQNQESILHRGARLFQQYITDQFAKQDQNNLNYLRQNQPKIRADLYQGLADSLSNDTDLNRVGRRIVLPSSYKGGVRDMQQSYQDAMAIVRTFGKPDYFITFTCNPKWPEIQNELLGDQKATDRPDLVARVFVLKLKELLSDLKKGSFFGKAIARVHVIEFQKRGLPHAHILIFVEEFSKPRCAEDVDNYICAEIPDKDADPELYQIVSTCMMHGPCGAANPNAPCMKDGCCSKGYPKQFQENTDMTCDSFPKYKRRNNRRTVVVNGVHLDNRWVVPYNKKCLQKYEAHINTEYCATINCVKYMFKYIYKGPDMASAHISTSNDSDEVIIDEIQQHLDMRYVSSSEAAWRIFQFEMSGRTHAVVRLPVHLPNQQTVYFDPDAENNADVLARNKMTMLTEWFKLNELNEDVRQYTYVEICKHYRWDAESRHWIRRKRNENVIGRMYFVNPIQGERYYLRLLLHYVKGATSFENLRTVAGQLFPDFKGAAEARGLIEHENESRECFEEAVSYKTGRQLRDLFGQLLLFTHVTNPGELWEQYKHELCDDILYRLRQDHPRWSEDELLRVADNKALSELQEMLQIQNKSLPLGMRIPERIDDEFDLPRIVAEHLNFNRPQLQQYVHDKLSKLTDEQRTIFDEVTSACEQDHTDNKVFFIDGPGGSGKTFTYNTILAHLRSQGKIALAVASCGVAALLLEGGQTAHSLFKIPINLNDESTCAIDSDSDLAELIRMASLIIWDEAPMQHKHAFEAVDRTLRDLTGMDVVFGGKTVMLGGDFRQILPVVPRGSRSDIVNAAVNKSATIWTGIRCMKLTKNMRVLMLLEQFPQLAQRKQEFADALLSIGNGDFLEDSDGYITLPESICIKNSDLPRRAFPSDFLDCLLQKVFPDLETNFTDKEWMSTRSILTSVNQDVHELNNIALSKIPGDAVETLSIDTAGSAESEAQYPTEFLNTVNVSGMPVHKLTLKVGAPILLMRNLNIRAGLSNGTRLIITRISQRVLEAEHVTGARFGQTVFIPRIKLKPSDSSAFDFFRLQFPVQLAFSMSINKAQGQTLKKVGVYLPKPVFSHGQLYVALSRASNWEDITMLIKDPDHIGKYVNKTKNIVFKNVLL